MSDTQEIQAYTGKKPFKIVVPWYVVALAAVGGWIGYSALGINHNQDLPAAMEAERRTFAAEDAGILSYYVDRSVQARPLVLIHSINAAGVAYEMRPLFEQYRAHRPVYALDLPGFGFSDRSNRVYSPQLYSAAILDLLRTQVRENERADVIALSLSGEFAALAAQAQPELFHSLTLISPSGLAGRKQKRASQQANALGTSSLFYRLFSFPLWGQAFYDLIATRPSIRFFLGQSFEGEVDPGLIDYAYATSHRPGARHAPLYFVSGQLFTRDIRETVYDKLKLPVLVIYDYDAFVAFDELPGLLDHCPNWRAARIVPTRGLPHWEKLEETVAALEKFWQGVG